MRPSKVTERERQGTAFLKSSNRTGLHFSNSYLDLFSLCTEEYYWKWPPVVKLERMKTCSSAEGRLLVFIWNNLKHYSGWAHVLTGVWQLKVGLQEKVIGRIDARRKNRIFFSSPQNWFLHWPIASFCLWISGRFAVELSSFVLPT